MPTGGGGRYARGNALRDEDFVFACQARIPASGDGKGNPDADGFLRRRTRRRRIRNRYSIRDRTDPRVAEFCVPYPETPGNNGGRWRVSHQRSRTGLAVVVLSVEQSPR